MPECMVWEGKNIVIFSVKSTWYIWHYPFDHNENCLRYTKGKIVY